MKTSDYHRSLTVIAMLTFEAPIALCFQSSRYVVADPILAPLTPCFPESLLQFAPLMICAAESANDLLCRAPGVALRQAPSERACTSQASDHNIQSHPAGPIIESSSCQGSAMRKKTTSILLGVGLSRALRAPWRSEGTKCKLCL